MHRTCAIPGCDDAPRSSKADWCPKHYHRWYRHGDPLTLKARPTQDLAGLTFGDLVALDSPTPGTWRCACTCGTETMVRTGDLNRGTTTSCGNATLHRRLDEVGYSGAHRRLRVDRGPASNYCCKDCGSPAQHWSYDHQDEAELQSDCGPYSMNPEHYAPRCIACHKVFDRGRKAA